jgi:hypothetical protein
VRQADRDRQLLQAAARPGHQGANGSMFR